MAVPFMPLYVADYMADTAHLTTVEHGAYLLLIMTYWQRGEALPNDDRKLARIAGMGPREWSRIRDSLSEFFQINGSEWFHSRIHSELESMRAKSLKKRNGGLARAKQMHSTRLAHAQQTDTDTDTEVLLDKSNSVSVQSDTAFWDGAKAYLGGSNPGALIGKWIRDHGQEETARAITAAQLERAVDPKSFVIGALRKGVKAQPVIGI
jgi:uncharacterized protein YdaU (DUF1376 family)